MPALLSRSLSRKVLLVAFGAAVAIPLSAAFAGGAKVDGASDIKQKIKALYNGEIDSGNNAAREKVFLEIDRIISKDKKQTALKTPSFWPEAIQEGRFAGRKYKQPKLKEVDSIEIDIKEEKPTKARLYFRGGAIYNPSKPCPLVLSVLEKGADPKAYLETTWKGNPEIEKEWVVAAIAMSDDFPSDKLPRVVIWPISALRDIFNIDANRWYLEGIGMTCSGVQNAASTVLPTRLAGVLLRNPMRAVTNVNCALYPTVVIHSETDAGGKAVFEAYKAIDAKANEEIALPDLPSVTAMNDQVIAWLGRHSTRTLPSTYTYTTTITDTEGEPWTGSLHIQSPGKRGVPTTVTVKYIRETNAIDIQCENLGEFLVHMNDDLLDLDKPVSINCNGKDLGNKLFERDLRGMLETADFWGEWGRVFPAKFRGVAPTKIAPPPAPAPGDGQNPPPAGGDKK